MLGRRPITLVPLANAIKVAVEHAAASYLAPFVRDLSGTGVFGGG